MTSIRRPTASQSYYSTVFLPLNFLPSCDFAPLSHSLVTLRKMRSWAAGSSAQLRRSLPSPPMAARSLMCPQGRSWSPAPAATRDRRAVSQSSKWQGHPHSRHRGAAYMNMMCTFVTQSRFSFTNSSSSSAMRAAQIPMERQSSKVRTRWFHRHLTTHVFHGEKASAAPRTLLLSPDLRSV